MQVLEIILLVIQQVLFLLARAMDDISWHDVGIKIEVFEGVSMSALIICALINIYRKSHYDNILKVLLIDSQIRFAIPWSLTILICVLYYAIFGCSHEAGTQYFYVSYNGCILNVLQILLTTLNYSLIANVKAHTSELIMYLAILFGQIIYNGNLIVILIDQLEGKSKDYSILYISLVIANQILIMDLIYRNGYERKKQEQEEGQLQHQSQQSLQFKNSDKSPLKIHPIKDNKVEIQVESFS